jgi:four helix bundle protein
MTGSDSRNADPIHSYRDLRVWQEAMNLAEACYQNTRLFPQAELYGMTSQIRRAAASVPANIAEGHGRENRGDYIQFLRISQGSLKELETHLLLSHRIKLMSAETRDALLTQCEAVGKMLRALIRSLQHGRK